MNLLVAKTVELAPIILQTRSLTETAKLVTNSTNPISNIFTRTKLVFTVCLPPNIKYPIKCAIFFAQLRVCIYTEGSTFPSVIRIAAMRQVLEEML